MKRMMSHLFHVALMLWLLPLRILLSAMRNRQLLRHGCSRRDGKAQAAELL